jgi:hypothetical protein
MGVRSLGIPFHFPIFKFFWQGNNEKKKYRLIKQNMVCHIHDLEVKNTAPLDK